MGGSESGGNRDARSLDELEDNHKASDYNISYYICRGQLVRRLGYGIPRHAMKDFLVP